MKIFLKIILAILIIGVCSIAVIKIFPGLLATILIQDLLISAGFDTYTGLFAGSAIFLFCITFLWPLLRWQKLIWTARGISILLILYCSGKIFFHNYNTQVAQPINWFNMETGKAKYFYGKTLNGEYHFFNRGGFNPETGEPLQLITLKVLTEYEEYIHRNTNTITVDVVVPVPVSSVIIRYVTNTIVETSTITNILSVYPVTNIIVNIPGIRPTTPTIRDEDIQVSPESALLEDVLQLKKNRTQLMEILRIASLRQNNTQEQLDEVSRCMFQYIQAGAELNTNMLKLRGIRGQNNLTGGMYSGEVSDRVIN